MKKIFAVPAVLTILVVLLGLYLFGWRVDSNGIGKIPGGQTNAATSGNYSVRSDDDPDAYVDAQAIVSPIKWRVEIMKDSPYYSKDYSVKGCDVLVFKDGSGINIITIDPDYQGKRLTETITIMKNKYGGVDDHATYTLGNRPLMGAYYDVFNMHCRQEAQSLPSNVKKLFLGQWGIE